MNATVNNTPSVPERSTRVSTRGRTAKPTLPAAAAICEALNHRRKSRHELDKKSKARLTSLYQTIDRLRPIDRTICLIYLDALNQRNLAEILASGTQAARRLHRASGSLVTGCSSGEHLSATGTAAAH
jgi:hypothetical protein